MPACWRVGVDGHGRPGKGVPANPGIRRTLTMKHVGWCTQEGPEEKTGEYGSR